MVTNRQHIDRLLVSSLVFVFPRQQTGQLLFAYGQNVIRFFLLYFTVNVSRLRCTETSGAASQVCGENGRTYTSLCHLIQQSDTQVRFQGPCNRTDCPDSPVSSYTFCFLVKSAYCESKLHLLLYMHMCMLHRCVELMVLPTQLSVL